ncbi:MAG: hypothetical protein M1401_06985, partial [Chloroflexi bacterium]|nr:hypothetical protein [Chloroflexota bacterium]
PLQSAPAAAGLSVVRCQQYTGHGGGQSPANWRVSGLAKRPGEERAEPRGAAVPLGQQATEGASRRGGAGGRLV